MTDAADIDESGAAGESPRAYALRLAGEKADAVARRRAARAPELILGADTIVVRDDAVLGKPRGEAHAVELLSSLVGRTHTVITAVAAVASLAGDGARARRSIAIESIVTMRTASEDEIRAYVATGEPLDKAGAYALQGDGRRFVERVVGSETNVIGLPIEETLALLYELDAAEGPL